MQKYTLSTNGLLAGWVGTGTYLSATTSTVGVVNTWTLTKGEISEIAIQAIFSTSTVYPRYLLQTGSILPPGLTLYRDGTIGGRVDTINDPTKDRYRFTATIVDSNNNTIINPGTFEIKLTNTTATEHTTLFCKPLLSQQKRKEFTEFINNTDIFIPSMIYRKFDPNFGVQKELKLVIFYELIKTFYDLYFVNTVLSSYKLKVSLSIGSISTAISKNRAGIITSEIIYLNVIDRHTFNNRITVPSTIKINGITYHPPSIINIRSAIEGGSGRATAREPAWSNTIQPGAVVPEYSYSIPLCFTLPGKSATILRKIEESGFKFNSIKYDIDRFMIESVSNEVGNKYVVLPRDSTLA